MDNEAIRREAGKVLLEPDFRPRDSSQWFNLEKWLNDHLNFKSPFQGASSAFDTPWLWQLLSWTLGFVLIILILLVIVRLFDYLISLLAKQKKPSGRGFRISFEQRQENQDRFLRQSLDALNRQDYRLAIHSLLLAAVTQVIRDVHFHRAEFMTNREMAQESDFSAFVAVEELSRLFQDMVYGDEPSWFGQKRVGEEDYRAFKSLYGQFSENLLQRGCG